VTAYDNKSLDKFMNKIGEMSSSQVSWKAAQKNLQHQRKESMKSITSAEPAVKQISINAPPKPGSGGIDQAGLQAQRITQKSNQSKIPSLSGNSQKSLKEEIMNLNNITTPKFNDINLSPRAQRYGDRCPLGYKKLEELGKGGSAIVWKAESFMHGKLVALKQFPKIDGEMDKSIEIELDFQEKMFN
jgi:hypothetical protein